MRKVIMVAGGVLLISTTSTMADVLGLGATVGYWDSELSGQAGKNSEALDVENDLNLSNDSNANLEAYFEHPVPILPNVRLNYTRIEQSGSGELSTQYDVIPAGVPVNSDLELTQFDATLYYEVLDNWVNLDLGLTARNLDGELTIRQGVDISRTEISGTIPMGYLAARFDLPFSGVSVGAQGNLISYDGDSISDFNAYGQYDLSVLRLRGGYREIRIDFEDSNDRLDVKLGGPFISAGLTF